MLGPSGFAAEGREWLAAIEQAGFAPSLEGYLLGNVQVPLEPGDAAVAGRCAARPRGHAVTFHHMLVHHWAPDPASRADVLATVFETEGLPPGFAASMNRADRVVVLTEWCRGAFVRAGVDAARIRVIPPPFAADGFVPGPRAPRSPGRPCRWLSVFDWSLRKGFDVLLATFARTFTAAEAELVLKVTARAGRSARELEEFCAERVREHARGAPPRVRVLDPVLDRAAIAQLYQQADAFVLPSRGEGWGRPLHEALLMELPAVATGAGALAELMPGEAFGHPVRAREVPVSAAAAAETPYYAGLRWHEPDPADLEARMRDVFERPDDARARARRARAHLLELCDPVSVQDRVSKLFAELGVSAPAAVPSAR